MKGGRALLDLLWTGMIIIGIVIAVFTGHIRDVNDAVISSAKDAVTLCVAMLGVMSMWTGFMKIAEESGMIAGLQRRMRPLVKFLFPRLDPDGPAALHISTNVIANILGLGWAATPSGILAMQELQKLNENRKTASREMCMFMIFNMTSLQLVSVNLLVFRSQFNSANPSEIIGPGLLATVVTTIVGVAAAKIFEKTAKDNRQKEPT